MLLFLYLPYLENKKYLLLFMGVVVKYVWQAWVKDLSSFY